MKNNTLKLFFWTGLFLSLILITKCKELEKSMLVSTDEATNVLTNSADLPGQIIDLGDGATQHGHYYGKTGNPSVDHTSLGAPGSVSGFTSQLTNLEAGTKYFFNAYITDGKETEFGKEKSFTTLAASAPTLTTIAVTSITLTGAVSGGNITSDGGAPVTARGVCWGSFTAPTIANNKTSDAAGTGSFTSTITGLSAGSTYFLRAYATNSAGTTYGNEVTFTTTAASVPTVTTDAIAGISFNGALGGGNVISDGGSPVLEKGVCWSTATGPTISNTKTTQGAGIGTFGSTITGLAPTTKYYLRAYATNLIGTAYGTEVSFTTGTPPVQLPVLTTVSPGNVTSISAICGGDISSDGGASITSRGVCWNTTGSPSAELLHTTDGTGIGPFASTIAGLTPNTKYYVRAYAFNSVGTGYGNEYSFTTLSASSAVLTTSAITSIAQTTASGGGNITSDGGAAITARGVCWSKNQNPTLADSFTSDDFGTGIFNSQLTGLSPGKTYYVRAYATNSTGTTYGSQVSFLTASDIPKVTTSAVGTVTATTADIGGEVLDDNGSTTTTRGVCYNLVGTPTISDIIKSEAGGIGPFTLSITGLTPATNYYVRAFATNGIGTAYGSQIMVTTPVATASLTTSAISALASTSAICGGNVTSEGGGTVTVRGVCWSTNSGPTANLSTKTTDGSGTGTFSSRLTSLNPSTTYYVRAYATNSIGTAYGTEETFTTTLQITDFEGHKYNTVKIGTQLWMQENLKVTVYRDGTPINYVTDNSTWQAQKSGAYSWYGNNSTFGDTYGALYNGYSTIDNKNLCPAGWHVPTDDEWTAMENFLITNGYNYDGSTSGNKIAKPISLSLTNEWATSTVTGAVGNSDYPSKKNASGLSALPGGYRNVDGTFSSMLMVGNFWSTTTIPAPNSFFNRNIDYNSSSVTKLSNNWKTGNSVRCLQGEGEVLPAVTTTSISGITSTSAVAGGNVTSDGNASVTARGVCWSTLSNPTILSAKTTDAAGIGSFTSSIIGLNPGTTYFVRAYATNNAGTAYGNELSFTTSSTIPGAPTIGSATAGNSSASVTFTAPVSNGGSAVTGYTVTSNPGGKSGTGTSSPVNVTGLTNWTNYTFTVIASNINGNSSSSAPSNSVIPGTVTNPTTGKIWMDRNLGASQVATSSTDVASYGDLYQWGRGADGHQIRTSGTTTTLSNIDLPVHANFILNSSSPYDWRSPQNTNLWQGINGVNNVCPTGFRIPTDIELDAERASWSSQDAVGAFSSPLKLPMAGYRSFSNGLFYSVDSNGAYWSSGVNGTDSRNIGFTSSSASSIGNNHRAYGFSVRCIKD